MKKVQEKKASEKLLGELDVIESLIKRNSVLAQETREMIDGSGDPEQNVRVKLMELINLSGGAMRSCHIEFSNSLYNLKELVDELLFKSLGVEETEDGCFRHLVSKKKSTKHARKRG